MAITLADDSFGAGVDFGLTTWCFPVVAAPREACPLVAVAVGAIVLLTTDLWVCKNFRGMVVVEMQKRNAHGGAKICGHFQVRRVINL